MAGEWAWPQEAGEAKRPPSNNSILGHVVLRLKNMVHAPRPATPPPVFPHFTLKACVLGKPCSGKSTCLAKLAQVHGIHVISPDTLMEEALLAHQSEEKVSGGGESPTVIDSQDEVAEAQGQSSTSIDAALDPQQEVTKRESSARAQHGAAVDQVLRTGGAVPDGLLVDIMVEAIRRVPAASGWTLDGFPATASQARLLERALGGNDSVPADTRASRRGKNSVAANLALDPNAPKKRPPPAPVLDLVLLLDVPDDVVLGRAVHRSRGGERVSQSVEVAALPPTVERSASPTIKEDPVETSSPVAVPTATPEGHPDPGVTAPGLGGCTDTGAAAFPTTDTSVGRGEIQHGIAAFQNTWSKLDKWYGGNQGILVRLDADMNEDELFSRVESVIKEAVIKKPKVLDTGGAPGSSRPATAPHQDPTVDRSGAQSPRGRSRTASLSFHPDREPGSPTDRGSPRPGLARWVYVEEGLPLEISGSLLLYWETVCESYVSNIKTVIQNLRTERDIVIRHLFNIREEYKHYLGRPDLNQEFVSQWQQDFNSVPEDMRADADTKAELHQRLDDLRERLWDISDKRREEDGQEKSSLMENGWLEDHMAVLKNHYATLMQVELDRFQDTLAMLQGYYLGMSRPGPPGPPTHFTCLPLLDVTDSQDTVPPRGNRQAPTALSHREPSVGGDLQQGEPDKCEQASVEVHHKKAEVAEETQKQEEERNKSSRASARGTAKDKVKKTSAKKKGPPPTPPPEPTPPPPVEESSEEIRQKKIRAKIRKEFKDALSHEGQAVQTRIGLVRGCALLSVRSLQRKAEETFGCMDQWLASRYLSQMNSVDRLAEVVRHHIELGSQLHSELVLDSTDFYLNGDLRMVASQPPPPRPPPLENPPHSVLTVAQLQFLHTQLCTVAPSGLLSSAEFTNVLQDLIALKMGCDCLPEPWSSISDAQVMEMVSLLTLESEAVDWRRFLLSAALPWPLPSLAQLLLLRQRFRTVDTGATGSVTQDQYLQSYGSQVRRPSLYLKTPLSHYLTTAWPTYARPGGGARRRAPGGRAYTHGARPGTARKDDVGPPSRRLTTSRRGQRGRVQCELGGGRRRGPWRSDPRLQKLALGTWNVTSLVGKEPELVREVEKFRLDIVGLTSTHSKGSGTSLLERGWTLFHSGVATGERRRAGVAILIAPRLGASMLEFTPVDERVASLRLRVGGRILTVVCAYGPNSSSEYPPFLDSLEGVLESAPSGDSLFGLLGGGAGKCSLWGFPRSAGGLQRSRWQRQ
ncbi:Sperm flagellar protein 2 [Merluccius polli]|uniref:Sperm flagellar protein 2 n=1 Tax=Merluccius polli TaxID=89951 RepID=A0AA47M539_MERPO|nr:Sperm flagellar protein 2 [Merluccius polli]